MTTTPKRRLWSRDYLLSFVVLLSVQLVFVTLLAYLALYTVERFSVQDTAAGFAASSFIIGASIARLFVGKYLDFVGRKRALVISLLCYLICAVLYPFIDHYVLLVVVRIIQGSFFGISATAINAVVIDMIPTARLSEGLGYIALAGTLTNAIGPLAAIQLNLLGSSTAVFAFAAGCALLALLMVLPIRIQERTPTPDEYARKWRIRGRDMIDGKVLAVASVAMMAMVGYALMLTFLTPYMIGRGLPEIASIFFLTWAVSMLVVRLFAGRAHDRYGDNAVLPIAVVSMASGMALLAIANEEWQFVLAAVLGGMGHGVVVPSLQAISIRRTTQDRIPTATATYYLALELGVAIGPVALAFLIELAGYQGMFFAGAGVVLAGLIVYWFGHGATPARQKAASAVHESVTG